MDWKNWKIRGGLIGLVLAIIVGPLVDFFERIPVIKTLLYPFFYFTFRIIGKPFASLITADNRTMIKVFLYITNTIIYVAIGFLIGYLISKLIKQRSIKGVARPAQRLNPGNRAVKQLQQRIKKDDKLVKQAQQRIKKDDRLVRQIQRKTR